MNEMKPDPNNLEHAALLARYLGGEMNENERSSFEAQFLQSEEDKIMAESLGKEWNGMKKQTHTTDPDPARAWDKVYSRIKDENLIVPESPGTATFRPVVFRIAAVMLVLVTIASILYFSAGKTRHSVPMLSVNTQDEPGTLVKTLADGSVVYLSQKTGFSYPVTFSEDTRSVKLNGEAFFDVSHDPGKPFIIETPDARIEVLGTAFSIKNRHEGDFELTCERGKVRVNLNSHPGESMIVSKGEKVAVKGNGLVKSDTGSNPDQWYLQKMHFKDETLSNILHVLNRNFGVTFVLEGDDIGSRKLTLTCDEGVEKMTELISLVLNLKSQAHDDTIVFSEERPAGR